MIPPSVGCLQSIICQFNLWHHFPEGTEGAAILLPPPVALVAPVAPVAPGAVNPSPAVAAKAARAAGDAEGKSKLGNVSEGTSPPSAVCPPAAFRGMLVNSLSNWVVSKLCSICGLHGGCICPRSKPSQSTAPKNVCDWISNVLLPAPHPIRLLGSFVRSPPSSDLETCERYGGNVTGLLRICSNSSSRSWQ